MSDLLLVFVGLIAGVCSGLFGIGGGAVVVPILVLFFNVNIKIAIGTSLLIILPTALTAAYRHYTNNNVDLKIGFAAGLAGILFAVLGSFAALILPSSLLARLFGIFLVLISIRTIMIRELKGDVGRDFLKAGLAGALSGFLSGLLGIGGGAVLVPIFIVFFGMSAHLAVGTSLIAVVLNSISGSIIHFSYGNVDINIAILLFIGSVIGAFIGAGLGDKLKEGTLKLLVGLFFALVGAVMIFS